MSLFRSKTTPTRYTDIPFFRGWSAVDLARLDRLAEVVEYEPGEIISSPGLTAGKEFLVITKGRAVVRPNRGERVVVEAGETIGEQAMLLGSGDGFTAVAETYLEALLLGPREFHGLLAEAPSLGRRLSLNLAHRLAVS